MQRLTLIIVAMVVTAIRAPVVAQTALGPVVVTGSAGGDGAGATYTGEDVRAEIGALWDVTRAFAGGPGVVGTSDRTSNLSVRGGDPTENLVRVDGIDIPSIGHMAWQGETGGVVSMLSPGAIGAATFYTGSFPARFGGRMSSVLDIHLRDGTRAGPRGSADLSPAGITGIIEGPLRAGRGSWIASYRTGVLDIASGLAADSPATMVVPSYWDAHAKAVYELSPSERVSAFVLRGVSDLAIGHSGADVHDAFTSAKSVAGATWTRVFGDGARARVLLSDVRAEYDAVAWQPPIREAAYTNSSTEARKGAEAAVDLVLSPSTTLNLGGRWDRVTLDHDIAYRPWRVFSENAARLLWLGRQDIDITRTGHMLMAYAEVSTKPASRLTVDWGVRASRLTLTDGAGIDPRFAATYDLGDRARWRFAVGRYRQSPSPLELTLHEANARLRDSRSTHVLTGVVRQWSGGVSLAAEAYVKAYRGLLTLVEEGAKRPSGELANTRERLSRGLEFEVRVRRPRGHVMGVVSASRATARVEPGAPTYADDFDYRLAATVSGSRELGGAWRVGAKWVFVGGRPYTEYAVRDTGVGAYEIVLGSAPHNGARYPSYRRLDIQVARDVAWASRDVRVFVEVRNALNRHNVYARRFDPTRGAFYPVHHLPRLLFVGVTASVPGR